MYGELGDEPADLDEPGRLLQLAAALAELRAAGLLRAYHDRSDGGLFVTLVEMAFAGHCGLEVALPRGHAPLAQLFAEEPGVVMQVLEADEQAFTRVLARHGLLEHAVRLGVPQRELRVRLRSGAAAARRVVGRPAPRLVGDLVAAAAAAR